MNIQIGPNEAGQRLDKFLRKLLKDVPLSAIYRGIRKGDIKVNDKKVKENYFIKEEDKIKILEIQSTKEKKNFVRIDNNNKIKIIYEDSNMLLVEKWPGVLVHSDSRNGEATLTDYVLSYLFDKGDYNPEKEVTFTPSPCNRLDRNTSGIVIYGKNYEGLKALNKMIRDRYIRKYYVSLVKGRIKDGTYKAYILKNEDDNISKIFEERVKGTKEISMTVKTLESCGTFSFVELELLTGRSHQLRAHLSFLGNPIVGDNKYGDRKLNSFFENKYGLSFQYLYANKLIFTQCEEILKYMENKVIAEGLPPILKKIKRDVFKF